MDHAKDVADATQSVGEFYIKVLGDMEPFLETQRQVQRIAQMVTSTFDSQRMAAQALTMAYETSNFRATTERINRVVQANDRTAAAMAKVMQSAALIEDVVRHASSIDAVASAFQHLERSAGTIHVAGMAATFPQAVARIETANPASGQVEEDVQDPETEPITGVAARGPRTARDAAVEFAAVYGLVLALLNNKARDSGIAIGSVVVFYLAVLLWHAIETRRPK